MKAKWYFGTLLLIFICFGAFQEQVSIPNQEIVLEFVDAKINEKDIDNTIAEIKEKLLQIGVENIHIKEIQKGTLKISYYSNFQIENIRKELAKENKIALNQNSNHKDNSKHSSNYNIDIHQIKNGTDVSSSNHNLIFDVKYNSDRYTTYNYYAFLKKSDPYKADQLFKTTYKFSKNNPFTKDRTSHKEPEVRAGPQSIYC
jgi:hypothetical protein